MNRSILARIQPPRKTMKRAAETSTNPRIIVGTGLRQNSTADCIRPTPLAITLDGKWVAYYDKDTDGKDSLYRVSVGGGEPVRFGDYPTAGGPFWPLKAE